MHSQPPSYSESGWTTLLTGAWPEISDGPAMNLDYEDIYLSTQDNIFSAAHRIGLKTAVSGYYWFEKMLPAGSVDNSFYTDGEDDLADQKVLTSSLPWLNDIDISLILIHLDQVDYAGHHEGGPRSVYWHQAEKRTDAMIHKIVGELDLNQDTTIILSDHGQIDLGGHGGQETVVLTEPYLITGKSIAPGHYPDIQMVDIAPTISVLLGFNIPATNQGQPLLGMLTIDSDKIARVNTALSNQEDQLLNLYINSIRPKDAFLGSGGNVVATAQDSIINSRNIRLKSEIFRRALLVFFFLVMCFYFIYRFRTWKYIFSYLLIGLIYELIFYFRYSLIDKLPFSLSWIPSQNELLVYITITSLISYIISWLLFTLFTRTYSKSTLERVTDTIFLTISPTFLVAIPIYISFVVIGVLVSWTLPDMFSMYLGFLALLQCLVIAITGIILTVLSLPIHLLARQFAGVKINENKLNH